MELEDLVPERAEWKASYNNNELSFFFRPFTLEDESWLKRTFGDGLQKMFEELQMDKICRMAYHQLELDSKRAIMDIKFIDLDEEGKEFEVAKKGPEKVQVLIAGINEQMDLVKLLLKTRGISQPILDEVLKTMGSEEK